MPLEDPTLDSRTYREVLDEAIARIGVHNPEWTNFSDADPGISLLQLFSYLTESIIYRANLIPKRTRKKFLRLLGERMRPATAASGLAVLGNPSGPLLAQAVSRDVAVFAGDVPFRTQTGLTVLPIESRMYFKQALTGEAAAEAERVYGELYASFGLESAGLAFYETRLLEPPKTGNALPVLDLVDTVDASVWLALLARTPEEVDAARSEIAEKPLTVGVLPALDETGKVLYPVGPSAVETRPTLQFELPEGDFAVASPVAAGTPTARYRRLTVRSEDDLIGGPGVAEMNLPSAAEIGYWSELDPLEAGSGSFPPSLEDTDDADRLITWIRIRSPEVVPGQENNSRQAKVVLSWVGINAVRIEQRSRVPAELLATGSGEPDHSAVLSNVPVIVDDTLRLTVNGERWERIDDLAAAGPEIESRSPRLTTARSAGAEADTAESPTEKPVKVFTIDPESGTVRFGNGLNGARVPNRAVVQASYDYGGGPAGNVGINRIQKISPPPGIFGLVVANPVPTWGGDRGETLDEAERRIPAVLTHRERLVSATDFKEITQATPGVDIGRVDVLPLVHPDQPDQVAEGAVTLMVVPAVDPLHPQNPRPDTLFLSAVCAHLAPRRLVTTEIHVRGPVYKPLYVSIGVEIIPGRASGPVLEAVRTEIQHFLSPLNGGFDGSGWPLRKHVEAAEVMAAATRVDGVASVPAFALGNSDGLEVATVKMVGLELPELAGLSVTVDDAVPIDELTGAVETGIGTGTGGGQLTPVPIVPEEC